MSLQLPGGYKSIIVNLNLIKSSNFMKLISLGSLSYNYFNEIDSNLLATVFRTFWVALEKCSYFRRTDDFLAFIILDFLLRKIAPISRRAKLVVLLLLVMVRISIWSQKINLSLSLLSSSFPCYPKFLVSFMKALFLSSIEFSMITIF